MTNRQSYTEEQLWRAFQYVSGDLTDEDTEAFEQQMLVDNKVCDAVAEATHLSIGIAACAEIDRPEVRVRRAVSNQPVTVSRSGNLATLIAVSCCLALTTLLAVFVNQKAPTSVVQYATEIPAEHFDAELLLDVWAESVHVDAVAETEAPERLSSDLDVPDWMLAAVTLADVEDRDDSEMPVEGLMPDDPELF